MLKQKQFRKRKDDYMEENMELALLLVNFMKKMVTTVRHPAVEDKEMKLTSHAFNALWILDRPQDSPQDSPVTMTALAEQMGISSQQLTKLINELEGRSLVARSHDRKNRRLVHVEITQTGRDFLQEHVGRISAELARRLAVLSEKDQQRLTASIETLDEIMDMMLYSHTVG